MNTMVILSRKEATQMFSAMGILRKCIMVRGRCTMQKVRPLRSIFYFSGMKFPYRGVKIVLQFRILLCKPLKQISEIRKVARDGLLAATNDNISYFVSLRHSIFLGLCVGFILAHM